jgi:hypothetical protein
MRRLVYMAALALVATLVLAPGATAQQMNGEHMMPNGQMMDDNMMASPSASVSARPSATDNGQIMDGNMTASPSASASASPSATPTASATPTSSTSATASTPRSHHHGGGGSSASAAVGGRLPSTGGVPWAPLVSVGALALLVGFGLAAHRLSRGST